MEKEKISLYLEKFRKLNRGYSRGLGKAPHKPILLLSILELIKKKEITSNRIFITPELVLAFKNIWSKLVKTEHIENFALPFYHMRSEPFWYLVALPNGEISTTKSKSIKSFKNLKHNVAFAEIDINLFGLLEFPVNLKTFQDFLIDSYFPESRYIYNSETSVVKESQIEYEIEHCKSKEYVEKMILLRNQLDKEQFEEEIFVRGGLFKRKVPKIYDNTCCISGMKVQTKHNIQMIDACHIYPFSLSNDDTVTNGIALSPNLHRAFDRGLLTITSDYVVRISPTITENESKFSLKQFEGRKIALPDKVKMYPSAEYLTWHNKEVFLL